MSAKPPSVTNALARAVRAVSLEPGDVAAATLAKRYALLIDAGGTDALAEFGPKLLATLEALKLTPKARAVVMTGGGPDDRSGQRAALIALRQRHPRED